MPQTASQTKLLNVNSIVPNPKQPRKIFDEVALQDLAQSIKGRGVLQPILVEKDHHGKGYLLVAGERRWRAARMANVKLIPALVRSKHSSDQDLLVDAMVENIHRQDMNPVDEGEAIQVLIEEMGLSVQQAALKLGVNRARLDNGLMFVRADPRIKQMVIDGSLPSTPDVTRTLMQIPDESQRLNVAKEMASKKLTVKECIAVAKKAAKELTEGQANNEQAGNEKNTAKLPRACTVALRSHKLDKTQWNAAKQLGKVPPWEDMVTQAENTCKACDMADVASSGICNTCPLVDFIGRLMDAEGE